VEPHPVNFWSAAGARRRRRPGTAPPACPLPSAAHAAACSRITTRQGAGLCLCCPAPFTLSAEVLLQVTRLRLEGLAPSDSAAWLCS